MSNQVSPSVIRALTEASVAKRAHGPVALGHPDVMLYMIEPASNKSKFYEMVVGPYNPHRVDPAKTTKDLSNGNPAFVLMRRWGRLTDSSSTGRVDSENDLFSNVPEAHRAMEALRKQKVGKGYQDITSTRRYPIGLGGAGFGWGTQAVCEYIPELNDLHRQLMTVEEQGTKFARMFQNLKDKGSSLVKEILPIYNHMMQDVSRLEDILSGQLAECGEGRRASERKVAKGCGDYAPGQKLIVDLSDDFALQTIPSDPPYCQTYETYLLRGPSTAIALAKQIGKESEKELERMKLGDAKQFMDAEIAKKSRRPVKPKWYYFVSPD